MALKDMTDYATFASSKESGYFSLELLIPHDISSVTSIIIIRIKPKGSRNEKE